MRQSLPIKQFHHFQVQRHLQLRIEAQGKYLQLVLKKAKETLVEYSSSSVGVELAKAELSQLVSMVNNGCTSGKNGRTICKTENGSIRGKEWSEAVELQKRQSQQDAFDEKSRR
ncbi:hypothetical protein V6N13_099736 [Hibiscus sabdariffa]